MDLFRRIFRLDRRPRDSAAVDMVTGVQPVRLDEASLRAAGPDYINRWSHGFVVVPPDQENTVIASGSSRWFHCRRCNRVYAASKATHSIHDEPQAYVVHKARCDGTAG